MRMVTQILLKLFKRRPEWLVKVKVGDRMIAYRNEFWESFILGYRTKSKKLEDKNSLHRCHHFLGIVDELDDVHIFG